MPREPLILLHVALTDDITREITDIVDYSRKPPESCEAITSKTTAIFYSITSTTVCKKVTNWKGFLMEGRC